MSYQEYAQLGKGRRPSIPNNPPQSRMSTAERGRAASMDRSRALSSERSRALSMDRNRAVSADRNRASAVERPYQPSHTSFSVPRRSIAPAHSTTSSTSSASLSPSNSASQKGLRTSTIAKTKEWGSEGDPVTLKQLKEIEMGQGKKLDLIEVPLPWRPFFLQRKVLIAFFATFAAAIITLEALLDYSGKNAGLGMTDRGLRYLWRFAPTAILTFVAVLWSRVEFQAKNTAPWLRLSRGSADPEKTLLLDYVSMFQPMAIIRAFKNGDYTVACATLVSLLLRISIVVSTGLISLVFYMGKDEHAPITVQSEFVNSAARLANDQSLALFTMMGAQQDNVSFPDGLSGEFAFQQFASGYPTTTEFHATVDGFSAALECQSASLTLRNTETMVGGVQFSTVINTPDCSVSLNVVSQSFLGSGAQNRTHFFSRFAQAACGNSTDLNQQRLVVVFATGSIDARAPPLNATGDPTPVNATVQSQQLLCKPAYSISKVDVVKNGTSLTSISNSLTPETRTLDQVQPWSIAQAFFNSHNNDAAAKLSDSTSPAFRGQFVNTDAAMNLAFGLRAMQNDSLNPGDYFNTDNLKDLANDYFHQFAAIIAQTSLSQPTSTPTTCLAFLNSERLVVRQIAVQVLAVLVSFMVLLDMVLICLVPSKGFLPRDPNTVVDMATLLAHSRPLLQSLRGAGGADLATLRERLVGSAYSIGIEPYGRGSEASEQGYFKILGGQIGSETTPEYVEPTGRWPYMFGLHPAQRVMALLVAGGLIASLEVTQRISDSNDGLGTVDEDRFAHYLWTTLPAVAFALMALFFLCIDFSTRVLAPYAELTRGGSFKSMKLNLLDKTAPAVFYEALRSRNIAVLGATSAAILAALLPTFTSSLYSTTTVPVRAQINLQSRDFFSTTTAAPTPDFCTTCTNGTLLASLVLNANLSYPDFTFRDLAFPTLSTPDLSPDSTVPADDLAFTATIPAARPSMTCLFFKQSEVVVNLTNNYKAGDISNPLRIDLPGESRRGNDELLASTFILDTTKQFDGSPAIDKNPFFGKADYRPITRDDGTTLSHWVYAWGQLSDANTAQTTVKTISGLSCNETMQQINAVTTLRGPRLNIDPSTPPQLIDSTASPSQVALPAFNYTDLVNISTPHLLDGFFSSLVSSRFAIPVADLASIEPSIAQDIVSRAIIAQHKIIRAQVLSALSRRPTGASALDTTGSPMGDPRSVSFPATAASVTSGNRRVIQDATTTRILQALFGAVIVFSILSWAALPKPNILPRAPTSIASVAALLADGNVFGFFGRGAEWQPTDEVMAFFRDGLHVTAGFTLAWGQVRKRRREEMLAAYGMNGSVQKEEVFGISAVRTGGWGGGENVGLGLQARVGYAQREYVRDWGWRT